MLNWPCSRFNPRTREGATKLPYSLPYIKLVSIHAPVRVRRPGGYGLSIKGAARGLRQPDAEAGYGQARYEVILLSISISQSLAASAGLPGIFCELGVGARRHQTRRYSVIFHLRRVRSGLHSTWFIDASRSPLPRPATSSTFLQTEPCIPGAANMETHTQQASRAARRFPHCRKPNSPPVSAAIKKEPPLRTAPVNE